MRKSIEIVTCCSGATKDGIVGELMGYPEHYEAYEAIIKEANQS